MIPYKSLVKLVEMLLSGFIAVLIVVTPREYIKAYVGYLLGDPTPKKVGRISLNPLVHLDPVGTVTFILFDFGWSRPVPIRPWNLKNGRKAFLFVSLLGPIVGVLCFICFGFVARFFDNNSFAFLVFRKATKYSLTYALFSLFPIPPLDGSRILGALLPPNYTEWYLKYEVYGTLFMLALVVLWIMPMVMDPFVSFIEMLVSRILG
ncbi:peptidase M50 [Pseudothermotoga thermarum DSM 5069]|uniref:Peptidase M50 n=2 Tax=Pseudothermotoga thermarum TaxID=119394 RepID=F7YX14_9THEM|nr:site-2 protease family protein [Pseudothermotoga thermarum]AEH50612.1 peptidase M50 [Pseudothermotoga thermarum DSM 5069]